MRPHRVLVSLIVVAAACGDDGGNNMGMIDAPGPQIDAEIDAPVITGTCDYTETRDATNDDVQGSGTPEATGMAFSGSKTICGQVDTGHFNAPLIDIDGYVFAVTSDADIRIDVYGTGAENLADLFVDLYTGPQLSDLVGERSKFEGNHAVLDVHVSPGTGMFELVVTSGNPTVPGAPIPYRARITADTPLTRCAKALGTANYAETRDTVGNGHLANDMVLIANPTQTLTTSTADLAEPTGLTIAPATNYRLTGSSADIAAMSSYKDRDTFELTTGATTNEIAVRLNWPGTTQDLDFFVFKKDTVPGLGRAIVAAQNEDEFKTFGVKPNTPYWVLVGNDQGSGAGDVDYAVSICGATFTP